MRRRWLTRSALLALGCAAALAVAACGGDDDSADTSTGGGGGAADDVAAVVAALGGAKDFGTPEKGGTFRIEDTDFALFDAFDPTGEYFGSDWTIYSNLMLRTLVSYNFSSSEEGGNDIVPDLATEIPEPTDGGKTYTFTLKDGITFGPPVNRAVTSKDIKYAIERTAIDKGALGSYANYYRPIIGIEDMEAGKANTASGITTPDDKTIVFKLKAPTGDFMYRLAMPATAPIPQEVAKCHTQRGEYGRYVISTGPYMTEGADKLDISSCATQKPISGFNPNTGLTLVRNPNYDPSTDDTEIRQSYPDEFKFTINTNLDNIFEKIERGELEGSRETPPNAVLRRYLQNPDIRDLMRVNSGDRIWYMYMNLTTPPFDDVHVRRAMNLVMDLDGILRSWGGPVQGTVPTHVLPNSMIDLRGYEPFQKAPYAGDVEAAKAEMKQSKYDTNQDGMCDAAACKNVLVLNRNFAPWSNMSPIIEQSAAKIGVGLTTREASRSAVQTATGEPKRQLQSSSGTGWGKDYADPSTFMVLFDGRNILPEGNSAQSLVGLTAAKAKEVGAEIPASGPPPSVDADIDACAALAGQERTDCWTALDKKITETVVPWIPLIDATAIDVIGPSVTRYGFDQFGNEMALAHVAVDPSLQK
ncbi:MAG: ABC transporter substrate-binding protein [Thermoleophilia bacterium]